MPVLQIETAVVVAAVGAAGAGAAEAPALLAAASQCGRRSRQAARATQAVPAAHLRLVAVAAVHRRHRAREQRQRRRLARQPQCRPTQAGTLAAGGGLPAVQWLCCQQGWDRVGAVRHVVTEPARLQQQPALVVGCAP